jgi:predicted acylesterase/phospholipase RssA
MIAILAALAGTLAGCGWALPDRIHYQHRPQAGISLQSGGDGAMVGLALSGGGSRAAVFAAAVLAELSERGIAERITHISSVSGGGFAASYWATHPLACADAACRQAYFAAFDATMREDFTSAMLLNQMASPGRITSPTRRATSLQEALDASFLNGLTFADLPPRPILLINAASYDNGRRFIFSNAVLDAQHPDFPTLSRDVLWASSFSLPDCPQPTPPDLQVSLAVVASAAFPPVIGPVAVQSQRTCADPTPQYWHLGDGGIIDNTGADSLREMVVRGVAAGTLTSALLFVADAGLLPDAERSLATADLSLFTSNPGAVVDTAQARGNALADLFWEQQRATLGIPFDTIVFRYDEADFADWPGSCAAERDAGGVIPDLIVAIPTALDISDCEADLLKSAAHALVERRLGEEAETLARHGLALPAGAVALR